jgi:hypothetical protein
MRCSSARFAFGFADQRDARLRIVRCRAHPFGAGARLAGAAAAENEPRRPVLAAVGACGGDLVLVGEREEIRAERVSFPAPQIRQQARRASAARASAGVSPLAAASGAFEPPSPARRRCQFPTLTRLEKVLREIPSIAAISPAGVDVVS